MRTSWREVKRTAKRVKQISLRKRLAFVVGYTSSVDGKEHGCISVLE